MLARVKSPHDVVVAIDRQRYTLQLYGMSSNRRGESSQFYDGPPEYWQDLKPLDDTVGYFSFWGEIPAPGPLVGRRLKVPVGLEFIGFPDVMLEVKLEVTGPERR